MASARSFPELSFAGFAGEVTDYVTGPTGTLARITNDVVTYLHPDHLGSAQAGTRANGTVAWREQYTPFGEELQSPAANDNLGGFTGHIKDSATGLNYMQARYYDPVMGRFLSVDPVTFMDTGNPSQFNRYAYTWNDPVNGFDPDGELTIAVNATVEGRIGSLLNSAQSVITGEKSIANGVQGKLGVAVSFPFFDGAKFDAGAFGSFAGTGLRSDPDAQSIPSLPGAKAGGAISIGTGSVQDLNGRSYAVGGQTNIGKKASSAVVDGVASQLPNGKVRDFVKGPVRKAANAGLGLIVSGAASFNDEGFTGVEIGAAKGLNLGVTSSASETKVCSFRGC